MADDVFFSDLRAPFINADLPTITLSTTMKGLYAAQHVPPLGVLLNKFPGKSYTLVARGKITTGTTPGNGQFELAYGTGADANGVVLVTSAAFALLVSQTNIPWDIELDIHVRSLGSSGTLFVMGRATFGLGVVANTVQPIFLPASAPVVSGACDLTNPALVLSLQFLRSGSTAETMTIQSLKLIANN